MFYLTCAFGWLCGICCCYRYWFGSSAVNCFLLILGCAGLMIVFGFWWLLGGCGLRDFCLMIDGRVVFCSLLLSCLLRVFVVAMEGFVVSLFY